MSTSLENFDSQQNTMHFKRKQPHAAITNLNRCIPPHVSPSLRFRSMFSHHQPALNQHQSDTNTSALPITTRTTLRETPRPAPTRLHLTTAGLSADGISDPRHSHGGWRHYPERRHDISRRQHRDISQRAVGRTGHKTGPRLCGGCPTQSTKIAQEPGTLTAKRIIRSRWLLHK